MNPLYAPKTPEGRLARLAEEVGEVMIEAGRVLQIVGRAQRFGMDSQHPDGGPTNGEALLELFSSLDGEMRDLTQAADLVADDIATAMDAASGVLK